MPITPMETRRNVVPRWARPVIAAALVLLLLIAAVMLYRWYQADDDAPAAGPIVSITATELARAYDQDPVGAHTRYGSRILRVTGTVQGLSGGAGDPVVILGGPDPLLTVTATFDKADADRLAALTTAQPVTVTCRRVDLIVDAAALDECTVG